VHLSKRIISVLCVITIVISAISPTFAYSATDGFNPVSFWEYVYRGFGGGNRDGGFGGGGFGGSDPDSWTTSDDMKNDYNDFVSTLPASGYDSAGKLLWQPKWIDFSGNLVCGDSSTNTNLSFSVVSNGSFPLNYSDDTHNISFCTNGSSFSISAGAYSYPYYRYSTWIYLQSGTLNVPISGNYYMLSSDFIDGSYLKQDRSSLVASFLSYSRDYSSRTLGFISSDTPYVLPYSIFFYSVM